VAQKSSKINVNGKILEVESDLNSGSYTVKYNGEEIGNGSAASGGKFISKDGAPLREVLGDDPNAIQQKLTSSIENENKAILKNNADKTQLLNLRDLGYGNAFNIPGVDSPVAPNNENGGNSQTGNNNGKDSGDGNPDDKTDTNKDPNSNNPEVSSRNSTAGDFQYPIKFTKDLQDHVVFQRVEYRASGAKDLSRGALARPSSRLADQTPIGTTILPMPKNVQDANNVDWGRDELNPLKAALGGAVEGAIGGELDKRLARSADALGENKDQLEEFLKKSVAGSIAGSNIFTRTTGAVLNNNLELLFNGPGLRTFNFSYKLTPREQKESEEIRLIIRSFKQSMQPILTAGQLFLNTPNVYNIKFMQASGGSVQEHSFLNRIKPCALTNVDVNYTPDNAYMTYNDGSMIGYELRLTFAELEPIYSNDYDEQPGDGGMGF